MHIGIHIRAQIFKLIYLLSHIGIKLGVLCYLFLSMYQRTPLHTAAGAGYRYTVEYLVKKGADITIKDNKGVSV